MLSKMFESRNKNKGFTIIEVIFAIFVAIVGILAAYVIVQQIISFTYQAGSRLTAAYLAKEGIEIVRNIRDGNWVDFATPPWDDGLASGNYEAGYNDASLTGCVGACGYDNLRFLKINGGFYNYSSGNDTKFKRKITITQIGLDELEISVEVTWKEKGKTSKITAQENLYNWKP